MGAGRNAVFLASLGWDVTGIDISDVAIERAKSLAATNAVKRTAISTSFREFDWGKDKWDLILNMVRQKNSWVDSGSGNLPSE
jgi:2-polyprenyl-3-methyl-5-hydroxy-6-metoxy-1,4-benzoquinol methylase